METLFLLWKYKNEIAIIGIIIVLLLSGLYIKHVFNERDKLEQEVADLKTKVSQVEKQVVLTKEITNAIQNLQIKSNNYVSLVQSKPKPNPNHPSVLIPGGLFEAYSTMQLSNPK